MFRCCLPCRGGSTAPATSPPNSPESENYTDLYQSESVHDEQPQTNVINSNARNYHTGDTQQQLQLPHIEEEEESEPSHHTTPDDCASLKQHLINSSQRSIRIVNQQQLQQHQQRQAQHKQQQQQQQQLRRNSGESAGGEELIVSNSPSPRSKHSRKQTKGRTKSIASTTSSSEGATSSGINIGNLTNLASATGGFLLPKMQAEQGSIGELQKYHSRYLKNRRHTLANVR